MKITDSFNYVRTRAIFMRQETEDKEMRIDYYLLALFAFAQLNPQKFAALANEIVVVRRVLEGNCVKSLEETKNAIRDAIMSGSDQNKMELAQPFLDRAEKLAQTAMMDKVATYHLVTVIVENLPLRLSGYFQTQIPVKENIKKENIKKEEIKKEDIKKEDIKKEEIKKEDIKKEEIQKEDIKKEEIQKEEAKKGEIKKGEIKKEEAKVGELIEIIKKEAQKKEKAGENAHKLPSLVSKVEEMTQFILERVKGQNHAVRAFAQGYFNSEVFLEADKGRKRPKATFLFAGPPGVGKTYLAQQAADYLKLPFKRIDMSSCSDDQIGVMVFQGTQKTWKSAEAGEVTKFVRQNPKCVLLFDEMEKAHMNVLYLFYQILDEGVLEDLYEGKNVSFKDVIIIMTTNVGHNLYEGKEEENLSLLPPKKIVNALKRDINPQTREPFFPEALVSRMAGGTVLMFNHLKIQNLQEISRAELERQGKMFTEEYGIQAEFDEKLPALLLYREGGIVDARTLTAQTGAFFKNQILKCVELFKENITQNKWKTIRFLIENFQEIRKLDDVFRVADESEILFFGNNLLGNTLKDYLEEYTFCITSKEEEAFGAIEMKNIQMVLLDLLTKQELEQQRQEDSFYGFGKLNLDASAFDRARRFVEKMTDRFPEIPIYVLERNTLPIDEAFELKLIQLGIRGKLDVKDNKIDTYRTAISECFEQSNLQNIAANMQSKHMMVKFDVSPLWKENESTVYVRCRNYSLGEIVDAEDEEYLVSDAERPTVKFADIVGAKRAKEELIFFTEYLKNPKKFLVKGLKPPKGLLFYGPPGTGKTMLAKAMAGETDIAFISESASNIVSNSEKNGAEMIRNLFARARRYAPAVLFLDEIDAIGRTRTGGAVTTEVALNTLLTEMDGFKTNLRKPVFMIAATNFKVDESMGGQGYIDPALVRRFDSKICIDLPTKEERRQLLAMYCAKLKDCRVSDEAIRNIADRSIGLSNAILANVVNQASRYAQQNQVPMDDKIFIEAFETTVHGEVKDWGYHSLERTAWHEAGHAYMYWKSGQVPSYLTIVARGNHGGYMQLNADDVSAPVRTKEQLLESVRVTLAGRASEIVKFGKEEGSSTGVSDDLKRATNKVKQMICHFGMDDEFGMIYIDSDMAKSPEMAMMIHKKAVQILQEQLEMTIHEIERARGKIARLVQALLDQNSLTGDEMEAILRDDVIGNF